MSETKQQTEPHIHEIASKPLKPWTFRVTHRHPAVAWLIVLLIVLQLVLGGIVAFQTRRLLDLGERLERLEGKQPFEAE